MKNHFPLHTAETAKALNACGTYLMAHILRPASGDHSNGGVSSRVEAVLVPCFNGNFTKNAATASFPLLEVIPPAFEGCPYRFKVANEARRGMAGANYVTTSDSRFTEVYGCPISIHDRFE